MTLRFREYSIFTKRIILLFCRSDQILREEGLWVLLKKSGCCLFSCKSYHIYESTLQPPQFTPKVDNIDIRIITSPDEIEQIESARLISAGFDFERDKEIVSKGAVIFYAFSGEDLAHVTQVFVGREAHDIYPFSFVMPYGHTAGLAAFTSPKRRNEGIHLYTRLRALQFLKEEGYAKAWDVQEKDNEAARNSVMKLGYYLWGEGSRLKLLSLYTIEWTVPKSPTVSRKTRFSLSLK